MGKVWKNKYRRINGNQFLFTNLFLPGTISLNGYVYNNILLRYDINSDEIMIPAGPDEITQLNKEVVDSFSLSFDEREYKFIKTDGDTLNSLKDFNGYLYVLYKQESALYIKYKKNIAPGITATSDGDFFQTHKVFLLKDRKTFLITSKKELFNVLKDHSDVLKSFIKENRLKVSKKSPESYSPVIRHYDDIRRQMQLL